MTITLKNHALSKYDRGSTRPLFVRWALALSLVLFFVMSNAHAQEFRGTISGTVTDPSGAVVSNALVTVTETNTGTVVSIEDPLFAEMRSNPGVYFRDRSMNEWKAFFVCREAVPR